MTTYITIQDLIQSLRLAASNPEAHAPAQRSYFSYVKENSVLVNCGTACCIAGDLMLKALMWDGASEKELEDAIKIKDFLPDFWVQDTLGLSDLECLLAFDPYTHYEIHLLLADLLEAGLRLPDGESIAFSGESTYTAFHCAYSDEDERELSLDELKSWMRSIAK